MNEHAGPASALSVLIVGLFAILLHDRQPTPPPRPPIAESKSVPKIVPRQLASDLPGKPIAKSAGPSAVAVAPIVIPRPTANSTPERAPARSIEASPNPERTTRPEETPPHPVAAVTPDPPRKAVPRPAKPAIPKAPFTVVQNGENLGDVANRIYGSTEAAGTLLRANRDQVNSIDSPLARGTLLRTP